jgi:N-acetylmuramoyl-L-alanine amidase
MATLPSRIRHLTLVLIAIVLGLAAASPAAAGQPGPLPPTRIVCVDAGHGVGESGATAGRFEERELTLDIAERLQTLLLANGYGVVMTRTRQTTVALSNTDRANICNTKTAAGAPDTVLSIHLNASTNPSIDYFKAFFGKQIKDAAFTQLISNNYALTSVVPNDPDGMLDKNPPTQFASGLLLKTNAPACLAETVFLSNPYEQPALADTSSAGRRQQIAQQLFNGLVAWYNPFRA